MDLSVVLPVVLGLHLLGVAAGFGLAIFADILVLRALVRPFDDRDLHALRRLHQVVVGGVALLWITGLALLYLESGLDTVAFTPRLLLKIGLVTLLTVNAFAIGEIALPTLAGNMRLSFEQLPVRARLKLCLCAGLSVACWSSALSLGVFSFTGAFAFTGLREMMLYVLSVGIGTAATVGMMAPVLVLLHRRQVRTEDKRRSRFLDHRAHKSLRA